MAISAPTPPASVPGKRRPPDESDNAPAATDLSRTSAPSPLADQEAVDVVVQEESELPASKRRRSDPHPSIRDGGSVLNHLTSVQTAGGAPEARGQTHRMRLDFGSFFLAKMGDKEVGEDAYFVSGPLCAFGIADGVGSWKAKLGVDAGEFARQLMSLCKDELEKDPSCSITGTRLLNVLESAVARTTARGSSTACMAAVDGRLLRAVNLGDSGFLVVRGDEVVYHSPSQQHRFNCPYQVGGVDKVDPPGCALTLEVEVEPGDIIVAASDGLFDNLFDREVKDVVARAQAEGQGTPEEIAAELACTAVEAYVIAQETPFSVASREAGRSWRGGKYDDVTVVVARVSSGQEDAEQQQTGNI